MVAVRSYEDLLQVTTRPLHDGVADVVEDLRDDLSPDAGVRRSLDFDERWGRVLVEEQVIDPADTRIVSRECHFAPDEQGNRRGSAASMSPPGMSAGWRAKKSWSTASSK